MLLFTSSVGISYVQNYGTIGFYTNTGITTENTEFYDSGTSVGHFVIHLHVPSELNALVCVDHGFCSEQIRRIMRALRPLSLKHFQLCAYALSTSFGMVY